MGKLSFEMFLGCRRTTHLCQALFVERVTEAQLPIALDQLASYAGECNATPFEATWLASSPV